MRGNFKAIIKNMKHRKLEKILIGLQIIITIALFLLNGASYKIYSSYEDSFEKKTSYNSKDILHIKFSLDAFNAEKYLNLKEDLLKDKAVKNIGFYDFNSIEINDEARMGKSIELIDELNTRGDAWNRDAGSIPILRVEEGLEKIIPFSLKEGRHLENDDYNKKEEDIIPVLIGEDLLRYGVLSMGDVIEGDKKLKVVGVLDNDNYWFRFKDMKEPQYISMNDKIIMPYSNDFYKSEMRGSNSADYYCLVEEGKGREVKTLIEKLGEREELSLRAEVLSDEISEYTNELLKEIKMWMVFLIIILIVISIGFMFSIMASLSNRRQEIGLRMAVGASFADVIKILMGEIFINVLVSGTVSIIGMSIFLKVFETPKEYDALFYMNPLDFKLILFTFILIVIVAIVPSIAVVINIKDKPLREYIRRK